MNFILASKSPRRKELLKSIGIVPDKIITADITEIHKKGEKPNEYALRLSYEKAMFVANKYSDAIILGADTVVYCAGKILHKAKTKDDIKKYLQMLSGRRHHVYTAITMISPKGKIMKKSVDSWVKFKRLDKSEINDYILCEEGIGKAGGYAIQGKASCFIKEIFGSYSSIVGLPLYETTQMLKQLEFKF